MDHQKQEELPRSDCQVLGTLCKCLYTLIELSQTQDIWPEDPVCIQPILSWSFPHALWEYFFTWFWVMAAIAETTDASLLPLVVLKSQDGMENWSPSSQSIGFGFWRGLRRWRVLRQISMRRFLFSVFQGLQTPIQLVYQPYSKIWFHLLSLYKSISLASSHP